MNLPYDAFASNVQRKASGVSNVVTITSRITAENSPSSTTPMLLPMPAKIKPTSQSVASCRIQRPADSFASDTPTRSALSR